MHAGRRDYMAFLRTELPRLQRHPLSRHWFLQRFRKAHRSDVLDHALREVGRRKIPGMCLELGVHNGHSIRRSAKRWADRRFYGFDSFEGFPDDGRPDWNQDFAVRSLPAVPWNVELVKGWFKDTLPAFLERVRDPIAFLHIDCDIYSSTHDVFTILEAAGRLRPGIVICFDDLLNYNGYLWNEMLALHEMLARTGFGIEWLCLHDRVFGLEETLSFHERDNYPTWEHARDRGHRQQAALVLTEHPQWTATSTDGALAQRFDEITRRRDAR